MARLDVHLGCSLGLVLHLIGRQYVAGRLAVTAIGQSLQLHNTVPVYSNYLGIQIMQIFAGQVNSALSSSIIILFRYIIPLLNTYYKKLLSSPNICCCCCLSLDCSATYPRPLVALTTTHHGTITLIPPDVPHQPDPPLPRRRRVWSDAGHVWREKAANPAK